MKFLNRWINVPLVEIAKRFPYMVLSSLVASIYLSLIILGAFDVEEWHARFILALIPGITLGLSEGLWRHETKLPAWWVWVYVIAAQVIFYFLVEDGLKEGWMFMRYGIFLAVVHLLLAAGIWRYRTNNDSFWKENITILLRFLAALVLSALLTGSIVLLLYLIDYLFIPGHFIDEEFVGVTATWAFLFYHPMYFAKDLVDANDSDPTENKVYHAAISYILTPMMCAYILIMFAYFIKIAIQAQWPSGGVSYWIAALSVLGTLLYLLGYQYFTTQSTKLNSWYNKLFFILTIPVLLLLFFAIYTRIQAYGWTENRYFVVGLGVWLLGISIYYIFSKKKSLYVIPLTLAGVLTFSIFGPWSAYSTARASQKSELKTLFEAHNILSNNGIQAAPEVLPHDIQNRIFNIVDFLADRHALRPFVEQYGRATADSLGEVTDGSYRYEFNQLLGIERTYASSAWHYMQIRSPKAIQQMDASNYEEVWFYDEFQEGFNIYPKQGMEKQIRTSLSDAIKNISASSDRSNYELEDCVKGTIDSIDFLFCCVICEVQMQAEEVKINHLSGMIYLKETGE